MRSDGSHRSAWLCFAISLVIHGAFAWVLANTHLDHPLPELRPPVPLRLLRETAPPPPALGNEPVVASPQAKPEPPAAAPSVPRPLPRATPPTPLAAEAAPDAPAPLEEAAPPPPQRPAPAAPPPGFAVVAIPPAPRRVPYGESEVDHKAATLRPLQLVYPRREQRRGREGDVLVRIIVSDTGEVLEVEVEESAGAAFDRAALEALRHARFRPALRAGQPVSSVLRYRVRFALH